MVPGNKTPMDGSQITSRQKKTIHQYTGVNILQECGSAESLGNLCLQVFAGDFNQLKFCANPSIETENGLPVPTRLEAALTEQLERLYRNFMLHMHE